ncbi:hypothetical protein MTsN2n6_22310 [Vibrio fortis]
MKLPVIRLCRWLNVSTAGYYKWLTRKPSKRETENECLSSYLRRESKAQHCIPGYRKLWEAAVANGFICNKKRVQRLLQNMGYRSCASKKRYGRTLRQNTLIPAYNILARQFKVDKPNRVWVSDITQVRCSDGWQYLCVVLDLFSRKVIGWSTSRINNASLVLKSLNRLGKKGSLQVMNSCFTPTKAFSIERWKRSAGIVSARLKSVCREKETVGIMLVLKASSRNTRKNG